MEEQNLYGQLFGKIPLFTKEHLETIINTVDRERAIYYLIQAVGHAYDSGAFTLGECEILSKSIRILTQEDTGSDK